MKKLLFVSLFALSIANAYEIKFINKNDHNTLEISYYFCSYNYSTHSTNCETPQNITIKSDLNDHVNTIQIPEIYKNNDYYNLYIKNITEKDIDNHIVYSKNIHEIFRTNCAGVHISYKTKDREVNINNVAFLLKDIEEIPTINCTITFY